MNSTIPTIDPTVRYRSVAWLRKLSREDLYELEQTTVIQNAEGEGCAVLLPFATFVGMQDAAANNPNDYFVANQDQDNKDA